MHVIGHGIDVIETDRIARMLSDHGERFLGRVYTDRERAYGDDIDATTPPS